jgi:beta-galactosidase
MQPQYPCQEPVRARPNTWHRFVRFFVAALLIAFATSVNATEPPQLGAQIWIEPGQSKAQIDGYFRQLADARMPVARLFLMWTYLEPQPGTWDFSLYDEAFAAAARYHVHIVATLTPSGRPPFLGGDGTQGTGVVGSEQQRREASIYLAKVVERYRDSLALDTWLLLNEPGQPASPQQLAVAAFRPWLRSRYSGIEALDSSWGAAFTNFDDIKPPSGQNEWNQNSAIDWMTYWRTYQTEQLAWLAAQVRRLDPKHPLHLNPHALVGNLAALSDNLPAWRSFLDTLGCSIHPAWHFSLLPRDRYALGVSYINDLISGSISPKPYWVTELQGGTNISSANRPIDPTAVEVAQWVWTSLGAGANRVIFWLLNARRQGAEAGEWSLLDFQQKPSDRLLAASSIASVLDQHKDFFSEAVAVHAPVTLILSLDTMTLEARFAKTDFPGRDKQAQILETLGFYATISRIGTPPEIKHFDDFDWGARTSVPRTAILPDVRSLTTQQIDELAEFTRNGNTLMLTGLTGFYDPHALAWPLAGFPLSRITGAELKEVKWQESGRAIALTGSSMPLPTQLWVSTVHLIDAQPLARMGEEVTATSRSLPGGGKVIWIPSPVGTGAWIGDSEPLADYLSMVIPNLSQTSQFHLLVGNSGCLLRVLANRDSFLTILTNGGLRATHCTLAAPAGTQPQSPLWGAQPERQGDVYMYPVEAEGTAVTLWRRR